MTSGELPPPPIADNPDAVEALRVWVCPGAVQQLTLNPIWPQPEAWGLLLADIARHAAKAYAAHGMSEADAVAMIAGSFLVEFEHPTDFPESLSE